MTRLPPLAHGFLLLLLSSAALTTLATGCADGPMDYDCTVTWTLNDEMAGTAQFSYDGLDDADEAVAMCEADQADHADRPPLGAGDKLSYACSCQSK